MIRVLFIALLVLTSCSDGIPRVDEPENLIPREKMVPLLTDLVKLEAYVTDSFGNITQYHKVMINSGDSLLKSKGFSKEQFEKSLEYYGSRQEEMLSIYADVLERLNKDLGELERSEKTTVSDPTQPVFDSIPSVSDTL